MVLHVDTGSYIYSGSGTGALRDIYFKIISVIFNYFINNDNICNEPNYAGMDENSFIHLRIKYRENITLSENADSIYNKRRSYAGYDGSH